MPGGSGGAVARQLEAARGERARGSGARAWVLPKLYIHEHQPRSPAGTPAQYDMSITTLIPRSSALMNLAWCERPKRPKFSDISDRVSMSTSFTLT